MEKEECDYDYDDTIIGEQVSKKIKPSLEMTSEEHKSIGSTPIEEITGKDNTIAYIQNQLKNLQEV